MAAGSGGRGRNGAAGRGGLDDRGGAAAAAQGAPVLAFTPAPFDYGQVTTGQTASQRFTLANTGTKASGKVTVKLTGSAVFTITGDTCKSLPPGKTCTVTVRFAPAGPAPPLRP